MAFKKSGADVLDREAGELELARVIQAQQRLWLGLSRSDVPPDQRMRGSHAPHLEAAHLLHRDQAFLPSRFNHVLDRSAHGIRLPDLDLPRFHRQPHLRLQRALHQRGAPHGLLRVRNGERGGRPGGAGGREGEPARAEQRPEVVCGDEAEAAGWKRGGELGGWEKGGKRAEGVEGVGAAEAVDVGL